MHVFVEDKRWYLRELVPQDAEALFDMERNPLVHRYLGTPPMAEFSQTEAYINYVRDQYVKYGIGRWALVERKTNAFMGWSGLKFNVEEHYGGQIDFYDIGYRLHPRFWGNGYAYESALASLDYGFNTLKLESIVGMAHHENGASNHILKKIGLPFIRQFVHDGMPVNWYELNRKNYGTKMS